jgi:DNA polymerase III subunit epsilon
MPFSDWLERVVASVRARSGMARGPVWDEVVIWALDLETSGLKAAEDRILSVGMVPIRSGVICYGERFSTLVKPPDIALLSQEGLRAHHILPAELAESPGLPDVLPEIDRRMREGLLLLHFASLDLAFLRQAYRRCSTAWPRPRVVDTVDLVYQLHQREQQWVPYAPPPQTALPLARAGVGLPAHPHHDALSDALATAELFLALRSRLGLCTLRASYR